MSVEQVNDQFPHVKTSLVDVTDKLPFKPPCRIYFKNEMEQPCGSFKLRGIGYMIKTSVERLRSQGKTKIQVFASSGGNAGLSAAYLSRLLGIKCTIGVPRATKKHIIEKLQEYGAEVLMYGDSINEADGHLQRKMNSLDKLIETLYCHPFENELVWEGHTTMIDEIAEQLPDPKKFKGLVCSVGGGGLYNGLMRGLKRRNLKTDILLIEPNQAPTFRETIKRKEIFLLDDVKSVATSLACSFLSKQSLDYYLDQSLQKTYLESIDDLETIKGLVNHYKYFNQIVEPACGAAVSTVFNQLPLLYKNFDVKADDIIVIVVCGGSCTNEEDLQEFMNLVSKSKF